MDKIKIVKKKILSACILENSQLHLKWMWMVEQENTRV